jgi:cell shape-determining protein MreC
MLRICLIIAIIAGLAAAALTFTKVQDIITTTRADRDEWHKKDTDEAAAHVKTKKTLKDTQATLATTQKNLDQTKTELTAAQNDVDALTKDKADLTAKLEKSNSDKDEAQQQLEQWRQVGVTPEQVKGIIADLAATRKAKNAVVGENKILAAKLSDLQDQWDKIFQNDQEVPLPSGLRGKIVAVDPKFNFVVLNIGKDQGVKPRGVMMVDKDGKLLGKVRITSVTKDECVANILTDWQRGNIMEGDEVLY